MDVRGFILQASYRIQAGVPVVYLYGRLDNGQTFLVRDRRERPHFYVKSCDQDVARQIDGAKIAASDKVTFAGSAVARVEVSTPSDAPGSSPITSGFPTGATTSCCAG